MTEIVPTWSTQDIDALLESAYTREGIVLWWRARNRNLDGNTPRDLWVVGQYQRVADEAYRVNEAAS